MQPLPADVAGALRDYLRARNLDAALWPRDRLREIVVALRHDLAVAGIPYTVEGVDGPLYADLHSLRHSYVLLLDQSGVSVKQAMTLARHSDPKLTMARYGRPQLGDLASAVARLPALATPPGDEPVVMRATGTEGEFPTAHVSTGPKTGPDG